MREIEWEIREFLKAEKALATTRFEASALKCNANQELGENPCGKGRQVIQRGVATNPGIGIGIGI